MSHSKRNTSLAFFTSHERSLLKSTWGSQATRLSRDSFLPFASCRLCLQNAIDPVACAANGDIFCRECAVSNLLAQRKEIKRLEKEDERRRKEGEENEQQRGEEEKERAVEDFERVMNGLDGARKKSSGKVYDDANRGQDVRGVKRKFELDEEEMLKNAKEERARARRSIDEEKASKPTLPSFWVPSLTPSTAPPSSSTSKPLKLHPFCPASSETSPHPLSLKTLVPIIFSTSKPPSTSTKISQSSFSENTTSLTRICPACKKGLSNGLKAMLTIPCGHVICKPCVDKFMAPSISSSTTKTSNGGVKIIPESEQDGVRCYVCETSLTENSGKKHKEKDKLKPGLVEISAEGTGFAGGGKNMAKREGVAFQC